MKEDIFIKLPNYLIKSKKEDNGGLIMTKLY